MTQRDDRAPEDLRRRDALAALCENFRQLRAVNGDAGLIDRLVTRARAGEDITEDLVALARRIGAPEMYVRRDQGPWEPLTPRTAPRPGEPAPRGQGELYPCPTDDCSRRWRPQPGVLAPLCDLSRVPLQPRTTSP